MVSLRNTAIGCTGGIPGSPVNSQPFPNIARMIVGPNHRRLIPVSLFGGAVFLMFCDLVSRVLLSPRELPIGVVTSFIGSILFKEVTQYLGLTIIEYYITHNRAFFQQ